MAFMIDRLSLGPLRRFVPRQLRRSLRDRLCRLERRMRYPPFGDRGRAAYLRAIHRRWAALAGEPVDPSDHIRFAEISGREDELFVPVSVWRSVISPAMNRPAYRPAFRDKNLSDVVLGWPPGPETFLRRMNGQYLDARYQAVPEEKVTDRLLGLAERGVEEVVIKPSVTDNGKLVHRCRIGPEALWLAGSATSIADLEQTLGPDFIVQEVIDQHPELASFHPPSLNTVRLVTLRWDGSIHVLPSFIRFGTNGAVTDNASTGGVCCGIDDDGALSSYAVDKHGQVYDRHPTTGVAFAGSAVPSWRRLCDLGRRLHERLLHFDAVSWDFAVDPDGEPCFIEVNFQGACHLYQWATGRTLFGEHTEAVLDAIAANHADR